jgi:acetylornithine deacetylase/succinyl-diaminopimelate desuccinylase-like protein
VDDRSSAIVDEWVHLVEIPAPSHKELARAEYIRTEMEKLGLTDMRGRYLQCVRGPQGYWWGPSVVIAAHTDTVFPEGLPPLGSVGAEARSLLIFRGYPQIFGNVRSHIKRAKMNNTAIGL